MNKFAGLAFSTALLVASATAQTGTVPLDNGTPPSGLTNSNITVSNGNVGIGLTNPGVPLDVNQILHVTGVVNPTTTEQGAYLGWNALTGGWGETDFINNQGGGYGGFAFMNTPPSGNPRTTLMFINGANGNVGIGTTSPSYSLDVAGAIHSSGAVIATGGITFQDGTTQTTAFNPTLCGGDYAESVDVTGNRKSYGPGDVLVIDPSAPGKFLKSSEPYSTAVLGIYSTKPGTVGRRQTTPKNPDELPMAMIGIVPTKVSAENGPIVPGDLLVTSSMPGYAMKGTDRSRMLGAVIGKALGRLDSGTGVIEVGVTLQ